MTSADLPGVNLRDILLSIAALAPLPVVEERLAEVARMLTQSDFAAIGRYDGQRLVDFVTVGATASERAHLKHAPVGRGLLGHFASHPTVIAAPNVKQHETFTGFPAGHPEMGPFLGVPVMLDSTVVGVFYVTRRPGGAPFGDNARQQLEAIAPYAAVAMSNAALLERERLSAATAWTLADAARQLQQAERVEQTAPLIADALERLCPEATGIYVDPGIDRAPIARGADGVMLRDAIEARAPEPTGIPREDTTLLPGLFTVVAVGLPNAGGQIAIALALPKPLDEHRVQGVQALLGLGTVGVASTQQREAEAEVQRYQVRDEIARDLHDDLIQSIYAVGLGLRAAESAEPARQRHALQRAIDDMNTVIRDLRAYITDLSRPPTALSSTGMLARRIRALTADRGTRPTWHTSVDFGDLQLTRPLERQLYLIVREAVSNVQRHAEATAAWLTLEPREGGLTLEVRDNGRGFDRTTVPPDSVGLRSIDERIGDLGGSVMIESRMGLGTRLLATFPVQPADSEEGEHDDA